MRRLVWKLAARFGILRDAMDLGYDWGWRAARANPEATESRVPFVHNA